MWLCFPNVYAAVIRQKDWSGSPNVYAISRKHLENITRLTVQTDDRKIGHVNPMFTPQSDARKSGHVGAIFTRQSESESMITIYSNDEKYYILECSPCTMREQMSIFFPETRKKHIRILNFNL